MTNSSSSVQLELYTKEIFDFLNTVTIKFTPFADMMGKTYMELHGLSDSAGTWNPYYINLAGEYADGDERMFVYSQDNEQEISFDKQTLLLHPKTSAVYRVGTLEYQTLCGRYPHNTGIIRSIIYPVESIEAAIAAPNFSLLAYDASILPSNERETILQCLREFLKMVSVRWYVPEFGYEDLYPITFFSVLLQHLPALLLGQRIKNIRTPYVHPLHIWEYLTSRGLGDYRDVLTMNQSLWLYRNIDYIIANRGKHQNLIILAENLLKEIYVTLTAKDMYQQTEDFVDECRTVPEFVSINVVTGEQTKIETFPILNQKLIDENLEHRNDAEFIEETVERLGYVDANILPTKYLEFQKNPINTRHKRFLEEFMLDMLMYRYSINHLAYKVEFRDPASGLKKRYHANDLVVMLYWTTLRSVGITPSTIPTIFRCRIAYQSTQPHETELPRTVAYDDQVFRIDQFVNVSEFIGSNMWHPLQFKTPNDFVDTLIAQYRHALYYNLENNESSLLIYQRSLATLFDAVCVNKDLTLNRPAETFEEWFSQSEDMAEIIEPYKNYSSDDLSWAEELNKRVIEALFPIDQDTYRELVGSVRNLEELYMSLKKLFIQLCSYDITFLDTERGLLDYVSTPVISFFNSGEDHGNGELGEYIVSNGIQFDDTTEHNPGPTTIVENIYVDHEMIAHETSDSMVVGTEMSHDGPHAEGRTYLVGQTTVRKTSTSTSAKKNIPIGIGFTMTTPF